MYKKYIINILFALLLFSSVKVQGKKTERPNILFCISDDQSWVHTSFAGEKAVATPAFDRIATEGLYFKNAFCAAPSCSASRGAIITGQEIWRLGEAAQLFSAVPKDFEKVSFPLLLQKSGYNIGYTLKGWAPNDFDVYKWDEYPLGKQYNDKTLDAPANKIVSNDYAGNFAEFLKDCTNDEPFFFWFGASEPHRAFEEGSGVKNGVDINKVEVPGFLPDVPEIRNDIADYLFEIEWFDIHLGRMIAMLEERDILDNTIIIVTSDNGMAFPGAKNNLYEYGIHMPLAIRWTDGIKNGERKIDDLVSLTDLAPTLLQLAWIDVPEEMTGNSLVNIFNSSSSGKIDKKRKYVFSGKERHTVCRENDLPYPQRSIRDYQYLYIRNIEPDRWPAGAPDILSVHGWFYGDIDMSPSQSYLLNHKEEQGVNELFNVAMAKRLFDELFDIVNDPCCLRNLASDKEYSRVKKRLSKALDKYLMKTGDPRAISGKSIWDNFPYYFENPDGVVPYSDLNREVAK